MTRKTHVERRYLFSQVDGQMWEGDGLRFRISSQLSMSRDSDGSWLIYSTFSDKLEDTSTSLTVNDPAACAAFDALFELIADPIEFKERTIGEPCKPDIGPGSEAA